MKCILMSLASAAFAVIAAGAAACSTGATSTAAATPDASSSDGGSSSPDPSTGASPHTPATGCRAGFVTCDVPAPPICAHLEDDYAHCGLA